MDISRAVVELIALGPGREDKNRECQATGFLVNDQGYILTNAHVVDEARKCLAAVPEEPILAKPLTTEPNAAGAVPVQVVALDELHDLALLKARRPLFRDGREERSASPDPPGERVFLSLDAGSVEDGAAIAVSGHPALAWHAETRAGRIAGHASMALSDTSSEKSDVLLLDIPLLKGSSGSPVYRTSDGGVVGIVERKDVQHPGRTVAVCVRYAIELLARAGVEWQPALAPARPD